MEYIAQHYSALLCYCLCKILKFRAILGSDEMYLNALN